MLRVVILPPPFPLLLIVGNANAALANCINHTYIRNIYTQHSVHDISTPSHIRQTYPTHSTHLHPAQLHRRTQTRTPVVSEQHVSSTPNCCCCCCCCCYCLCDTATHIVSGVATATRQHTRSNSTTWILWYQRCVYSISVHVHICIYIYRMRRSRIFLV